MSELTRRNVLRVAGAAGISSLALGNPTIASAQTGGPVEWDRLLTSTADIGELQTGLLNGPITDRPSGIDNIDVPISVGQRPSTTGQYLVINDPNTAANANLTAVEVASGGSWAQADNAVLVEDDVVVEEYTDAEIEVGEGESWVPILDADAIPDSVTYQFVGANATDGGDWTSEDGLLTLSATGSPTVQSGVLNGEDVVYYDGSDDYHLATLPSSLSQPYAITAVYRYETFGQTGSRAIGDTISNGDLANLDPDDGGGNFRIQGANSISGSAGNTNWVIHSGYFDGASSESRLNGATDASGDIGGDTMSDLAVAVFENTSGDRFQTEISHAEFFVYDNPTLSDVQDGESYLNGKYGVY